MTDRLRVLVTGGAGFVGANVVRELVAFGHCVRVYDNFAIGSRTYVRDVNCEVVEGDVLDGDALARAISGVEAVVHLAASGSVVGSVEDPVENFNVNVVGTFRLLEACRACDVDRVVLASTGGALFGETVAPVDETSLPTPISPYGASKLAGEGYALAFARSYGLNTITLRFANVYGPWSAHKTGVTTSFLRAIAAGRPMVVFGDGSSSRDYIHVSDIAKAVGLALGAECRGGEVVHVATGVETTVRALAQLCRIVAGSPDHPIDFRPKRIGEVDWNVSSFDEANALLGFKPSVELEDGLRQTWQWMRAFGW
jgi:UDP-glucose 4-epimerase